GWAGSLFIALSALRTALREPPDLRVMHTGLLAGVGFAAAYAMSMSWATFEPMALPSLAVCIAFLLEASPFRRARAPAGPVLVAVCLALVVRADWRKDTAPCSVVFWADPPLSASDTAPLSPRLAGFRLAPESAQFYDEIAQVIQAHSGRDDTVLIFPHLPMLYGLADRTFATF